MIYFIKLVSSNLAGGLLTYTPTLKIIIDIAIYRYHTFSNSDSIILYTYTYVMTIRMFMRMRMRMRKTATTTAKTKLIYAHIKKFRSLPHGGFVSLSKTYVFVSLEFMCAVGAGQLPTQIKPEHSEVYFPGRLQRP